MKIAGWIFVCVGLFIIGIGTRWTFFWGIIDPASVGAIVGGITFFLCGLIFFKEAEEPELKPTKEKEKEEGQCRNC